MVDRNYEMGHEKIGRLLVLYSAPAMVAMSANSLYNLVDAIFVGRGAGALALAGLAVSFPIQMIILAVAQVVGIGSASIISRCLGAGDIRKAEATAGASFATVGVLSLILTVAGLAFLTPLLRLFGASDDVLPYAKAYMSVILMGSFFFAFLVSSNNIVRSEGNAKLAMISMLIGAVVNIVLDPIFIFTLGLGIRGAAIATVIAQFCSFLFLCWYFVSGKSMLHIRLGDLRPDLSRLPEVFIIGSPSLVRVAGGNLVAIVLNHSVVYYGGDTYLAIFGICNRMLMFTLMPIIGLVQGMQPIVGFNYGAQNMKRVRETVVKAAVFATAISCLAFLLLQFFPQPLFSLFSKDALLIREGSSAIRVIVIMLPFVGFHIVGATLFQAIGKAVPALFLSMSRQVLFLVPLLLILPLRFKLAGIWASFPVADLLSVIVTGVWVLAEMRRLERHLPASPEIHFQENILPPFD